QVKRGAHPLNKMGKSNSKPLTGTEESEKSQPVRLLGKRLCDRASCKNRKPKLKGCAKIMCEKHGDETCKQLPFWVDTFGFPENGSFSVRLIQRLQEELEDYEKKGYATRTQKTHSIIQIVQVPYAYEVWTPDELRLIANELPDIAKRGGAAFVEILSQIVQQFKPSLREILSLVIHNLKLKFGKVQGDWPERLRDARYDWTPGAGYREHVEELCERIKTTFPAIVRWKAIDCRQKPGEMVEDYLIRLTKDFDENSGLDSDKPMYGFLLMNYFLLGLDKQIKDQARKHSQFWEIGPLSSIRAHAVRAEETLRDLDDKKKQATARLEERLMKASSLRLFCLTRNSSEVAKAKPTRLHLKNQYF
uniref:Uncharacterized protein n=1 Tax=Sander lucioperca TaxID=283035 RepID=A0A8C9Z7E6_SANLU